jgi:hypothetical protein
VKAEKPLSFHTDCKATTNASIISSYKFFS